jgi:hypothetical protein
LDLKDAIDDAAEKFKNVANFGYTADTLTYYWDHHPEWRTPQFSRPIETLPDRGEYEKYLGYRQGIEEGATIAAAHYEADNNRLVSELYDAHYKLFLNQLTSENGIQSFTQYCKENRIQYLME